MADAGSDQAARAAVHARDHQASELNVAVTLELRGTVLRSLGIPVRSSGQHASPLPFTIDLDAGTVHSGTSTAPALDLRFDPAAGLDALNGAGISVTGSAYGALTPVQLRTLGFGTRHLAAGAIPAALDIPGFGAHAEIVCGVRTNLGRLAKLRAWRDLLTGMLRIQWTTYWS